MPEPSGDTIPEGKLPQDVEETVLPVPQRKPRSTSASTQRKRLENEDFEGDIRSKAEKRGQAHKFRKHLFWMSTIIVLIWTIAVFTVVGLTAGGYFTLSDSVLIALISTSLPNVFGIFLVVVKYSFRHD